ncbi:hypothetical protein [Haloarcula halophila]|uniref:hypothetical protein n=1 Tax=Haloarcula TaxID=2237 RepID=UPI0023E3BAC2|nr:hypothetical protein [Halomicroarcula sp. DFY41]
MGTYATHPTLDQSAAETVLNPPGEGEGNWIGAPCVHDYDGTRLLAVRERTPEERGRELRIYRVDDTLEELWSVTADELAVVSIERPAMATAPDTGRLVLYVPVDHGANQWTIQRLDAVDRPADLDPATTREVLTPSAGTTDAVTVKDPYVLTVGGRYYMFYAGHDGVSERAHLATSVNGETFARVPENPVLDRQYWHDHHTRVSCVRPASDAPTWQVFYEGSSHTDHGETWNLRTGVATAERLAAVVDTAPDGPQYAAPTTGTATGVDEFATLRYLDVAPIADGYEAYYEVARADGAFELRRAPLTDE